MRKKRKHKKSHSAKECRGSNHSETSHTCQMQMLQNTMPDKATASFGWRNQQRTLCLTDNRSSFPQNPAFYGHGEMAFSCVNFHEAKPYSKFHTRRNRKQNGIPISVGICKCIITENFFPFFFFVTT